MQYPAVLSRLLHRCVVLFASILFLLLLFTRFPVLFSKKSSSYSGYSPLLAKNQSHPCIQLSIPCLQQLNIVIFFFFSKQRISHNFISAVPTDKSNKLFDFQITSHIFYNTVHQLHSKYAKNLSRSIDVYCVIQYWPIHSWFLVESQELLRKKRNSHPSTNF